MDLLLDVDIVVDICTQRSSTAVLAQEAIRHCRAEGGRVWLYTGAVNAYQVEVAQALAAQLSQLGHSKKEAMLLDAARALLQQFAEDKHWLAALAGEGDVYDSVDPGTEQFLRALTRFDQGKIVLLTSQAVTPKNAVGQTMTPVEYCRLPFTAPKIDFIDLKRQQDLVRPGIEQQCHRVLQHGRYIMGPEVAHLERRLAEFVGVEHCIGVASGTDALMIAMMALGIKAGDEVITTPFTFIATGEIIALLGAKPIFADIDPKTYNLDPKKIEALITTKTKLIMPVSLYGQCADFDTINTIADQYGIPVIEDGAQSLGATYKGRSSCGLSTIGCTSFFPSKPLGGCGDGGACFTNDDTLAKTMREIRVHGQDRRYHHPIIGLNGRLDTLQAAVLLAKLDLFMDEIGWRSEVGQRYSRLIAAAAVPSGQNIVPPYIEQYNTSVYAQYTILVQNRAALQKRFKEAGIPTAVHYPVPLNKQPALATDRFDLPIAEALSEQVMSIPMHPYLTEKEQQRIVEVCFSPA